LGLVFDLIESVGVFHHLTLQLRFIGFEIHDKDVLEEFKSQYPDKTIKHP
jgi:hypothetical protein